MSKTAMSKAIERKQNLVDILMDVLSSLGSFTLRGLNSLGDLTVFCTQTMWRTIPSLVHKRDLGRLLPLAYAIGAASVPVILITGMFVGMVLAVNAMEQFKSVGLANRMGVIVTLSVVRELGPVLAGVMLAGRVGGALTAELGTMNVTEQLDALRSMGSDPIRVLSVPRFVACVVLTPILTLYCNIMGIFGGWVISVPVFSISNQEYWNYTLAAVELWDVGCGLFKSVFFGGAIGLLSCYKGFNCRQGAQGVGQACTEAFVTSFVVILILDFMLGLYLKGAYESIWGFKAVF
ncbi:MAG: ABC transporter permease [Phycisphaerae bacterium]|nr:ABC transporter permease [Phycisphaerae bacterium]